METFENVRKTGNPAAGAAVIVKEARARLTPKGSAAPGLHPHFAGCGGMVGRRRLFGLRGGGR